MVGLVVVSHSRPLARAAVALAAEMVRDRPVRIEIAAGLDETTFGTDAIAITEAVAAADDGDGVVVLMDLGSAVLSAELALELLPEDLRRRVVLCPAPLVEGLVAAVVAAAGGAGRDEVAAEATAGLAGKQSQLSPADSRSPGGSGAGGGATITVTNRHGLHARPAARLVTAARASGADVQVRNVSTGSAWVPASSLSRVATLGVHNGHRIEVRATGPRAREAVDRIVALAGRAFDEIDSAAPTPQESTGSTGSRPDEPTGSTGPTPDEPTGSTGPTPDEPTGSTGPTPEESGRGAGPVPGRSGVGLAASAGIGVGVAWRPASAALEISETSGRGAVLEQQRMDDALTVVRQRVEHLRAATARDAGDTPAAIFDAHLLLLDDADLLAEVRARIDAGEAAPRAWTAATGRVAGEFEALADPYLRGRAADVRALADQTLRVLLGVSGAVGRGSGVLVAADLTPAEAAGLDAERVAGVLLAFGSPAAHSSILLRTRGIPAVVGAGPGVLRIDDGTPIGLDGSTGEVLVAPSDHALAALRGRAAGQASRQARAAGRAGAPAVTRDGVPVSVGANVGSLADARVAADCGADLVGLIRTEFLFLDRDAAPEVDEQEAAWRAIGAALGGRRITVRTLDVGGDKPLRYLPAPVEQNPFLGVRGLRYTFDHPRLLADQLLAVVRVARDVPVSVMFPMVSTVDEVIRARRMLDDAVTRVGGGVPVGLRVGIMVEVPAAALKAAAFVPYVDFFSIGTNDLTQYALAAERGNPALATLADGLDPGVLRLIDAVCRGAGGRVPVAVCGDLAGDETATPLLTGLGVRALSVVPRAVPAIKEAVRATDLGSAAVTARATVDLPDAAAVRARLGHIEDEG